MNAAIVYVLSVVILSSSLSSYGAVSPKTDQETKLEPLTAVTPAVIRSLKKSITRKQLVTALLANPQAKPIILKETSKHGLEPGQLGTLATKPLPRTLSGSIVQEIAQMKADELDYARINWTSGINITPEKIPTYGSGKWKVAALTVRNATFTTSQPDVLTISTKGEPYITQVITCDLELPLETALYAVTIRLVRNDGYIDSRWVTYEKNGYKPIQVGWQDITKLQYWTGSQVELVTCPEVGGYVALVRANPVGITHFDDTGMRKVTSRLTLSFYPFAELTTTPLDDQVFGGITITRL